jgi:ankyrin repeat protein
MRYRSLRRAASGGDLEEVRRLCDEGARIDEQDARGSSALGGAVANGHIEVAALLLERGANVNVSSPLGWTPVFTAVQRKNPAMLRLLLTFNPALEPRTVDFLPTWDRFLPGVSPAGYTPLHQATANGRADLAEMLLEAGADANPKAESGATPLHFANRLGGAEMIVLLLRYGADPAIKDPRP